MLRAFPVPISHYIIIHPVASGAFSYVTMGTHSVARSRKVEKPESEKPGGL